MKAKKKNQTNICPSRGQQIYKLNVYVMEYYAVIKKQKLLIHATACMHFNLIIFSERSQMQRLHYIISFIFSSASH
jgi:hypothetical protein